MSFLSTFNHKEVDYSNDNEILPVGEYVCIVEKIEERAPEGKTPYVSVQLKVAQGDHKNRVIFDNNYLSEKAMKMTSQKLGRMVDACKANNILQCQGKLVKVKLGLEPASEKYSAKNVVKEYLPTTTITPTNYEFGKNGNREDFTNEVMQENFRNGIF